MLVKLDTPASSRIDAGTAFSGGYVLVGSTEDSGRRSCGAYVTTLRHHRLPRPDENRRSLGGRQTARRGKQS